MTKTFESDSINNENFLGIPNLATTYFNSRDETMNRTVYQVNRTSNTTSSITPNTTSNGNRTSSFLYPPEPSNRPFINSRIIGIIFLLILVLVSIAFLTFAIFYDEVFKDDDDDNDNKKLDFVINSPLNGSEIQLFYIDEEAKNLTEKSLSKSKEIALNDRQEIHLNITSENNFDTTAENRVNKTLGNFSEEESLISRKSEGKTLENVTKKLNITFENFINGEFTAQLFSGKWISSNELLHYDSENNLCITTVPEMNKSVLIHNYIIRKLHLYGLSLSADRDYLLIAYNARRVYRYSSIAKYRVFSIKKSILLPAIVAPETPRELRLQYAEWGPIRSQLVFIHRNNIYYKADINTEAIRITYSGKEQLIYNGIPDWVYEEEIISGPKTFWLSPDGKRLAFSTINDSMVDIMSWPYYGPYSEKDGTINQYTKIVYVRYPKPGRPNPTVQLNVISLTTFESMNESLGSDFKPESLIIPLKPPKDIKQGDHYFTTFKWIDNNSFAINWMTRAQNVSVLTSYSEKSHWQPLANFKIKSKNGWIDFFTPPLITPDKKSYLIHIPKLNANKNDFFTQIAKVSIETSETQFLTSGDFEVKELLKINPSAGKLYFTATFPNNPGEKNLMSVSLFESNNNSVPICHTCSLNAYRNEEGVCLTSHADFSVDALYYVLQCKGPNIPRSDLYSANNDLLIDTLEDNRLLKLHLEEISLPKRIIVRIPVEGIYNIDVMLIVPEDFDQNSTKKYPLILHIYGGPGSDSGSVTQNYIYNQFSAFMASNRSVIYALIDARGSPNHGIKFMYAIYRKFGSVEVEDTIIVARYFRDHIPYIDRSSISIWGWSYGGYLTTMALIQEYNDTVFNCGVAVAPVSDWMFYGSTYVERYMGFPTAEDNLENYRKSSTLDKVKYLNGKKFLIMFGTADDNVHSQNSMMLMKAMNEANIKYETQVYPDNNHNLQNSLRHMYSKMTTFLDKCYEK